MGEHSQRGYRHHHLPSLEIGGASYDDDRGQGAARMAMHLGGMGRGPSRSPSHGALVDFNEQFRSPMSDDWVQPRKARWNRKVGCRPARLIYSLLVQSVAHMPTTRSLPLPPSPPSAARPPRDAQPQQPKQTHGPPIGDAQARQAAVDGGAEGAAGGLLHRLGAAGALRALLLMLMGRPLALPLAHRVGGCVSCLCVCEGGASTHDSIHRNTPTA